MIFRRRLRPLLGTFVEIGTAPSNGCDSAIELAFAKVKLIEALLSYHSDASDLTKFNMSSGDHVSLASETIDILRLATSLAKETDGLFNPFVGYALEDFGHLPLRAAGQNSIAVGNFKDIEITSTGARKRREIRIVLDGIAKGFAVDLAVAALVEAGIEHGFVNAGGDIRVIDGTHLPVWIRNADGTLGEFVNLSRGALATSSYHRELDPSSPAVLVPDETRIRRSGTWTVTANEAWRADALTKVAAQLGAHELDRLSSQFGGTCVYSTVCAD